MNKFLLAELDKLGLTWQPNIYIPKKTGVRLKENEGFIIKVNDRLLNLPQNDPLIVNWNNGMKFIYRYYKVSVEKLLPDRMKVTGIGFDLENNKNLDGTFFGWIPIRDVEVIKKI